ncbi:MAG: hypothetical protein P0S96_06465 [Simkaniaceae bacterium]|nr:hypothetical protein [Candidatus Sacchlamyda saccharinae]
MATPTVTEYEYVQPTWIDQVGDYLTGIASAVLSVFRRILGMEDAVSSVDLQWNAAKCRRLQGEKRMLERSNQDLQARVRVLQRVDHRHSFWEKVAIESTLFLTLAPLYLLSIPVIMIRDAMYERKNFYRY